MARSSSIILQSSMEIEQRTSVWEDKVWCFSLCLFLCLFVYILFVCHTVAPMVNLFSAPKMAPR